MSKSVAYAVAVLMISVLVASSGAAEQPKKKSRPPKTAATEAIPRELLRGALAPVAGPGLYETDFSDVSYGGAPDGWLDLGWQRPSRNWAVDGNGFLRLMVKRQTGTITYNGALG